MARITIVQKARKDQGSCEKCGAKLGKGSSYKWCAPRAHRASAGRKRKRCLDCPSWRPSETTSSQHKATIYAAQEAFEDFVGSWSPGEEDGTEDIAQALRDAGESIREAAESYRESAQAIEEGFGHSTYVSDELNEKADEVEGWADTIDSHADDFPDLEDFTTEEEVDSEDDDAEPEYVEVPDLEAWVDACIEHANEVITECPV